MDHVSNIMIGKRLDGSELAIHVINFKYDVYII